MFLCLCTNVKTFFSHVKNGSDLLLNTSDLITHEAVLERKKTYQHIKLSLLFYFVMITQFYVLQLSVLLELNFGHMHRDVCMHFLNICYLCKYLVVKYHAYLSKGFCY